MYHSMRRVSRGSTSVAIRLSTSFIPKFSTSETAMRSNVSSKKLTSNQPSQIHARPFVPVATLTWSPVGAGLGGCGRQAPGGRSTGMRRATTRPVFVDLLRGRLRRLSSLPTPQSSAPTAAASSPEFIDYRRESPGSTERHVEHQIGFTPFLRCLQ